MAARAKRSARKRAAKRVRTKPARTAAAPPPAAPPGDDWGETLVGLLTAGVQRHQAGDVAGAEAAYRKALEVDANHPHALQLLGVVHHQRGDNDQAVALIERSLAIQPDLPEAHSNLGAALFALKRLPEAAEHFRRAAELNPEMAEAHSNLAAILKDQGRIKEAVESYQAAHRASPGTPKFIKRLADLYLAYEQFDEAIDWFGRYLALAPDDAEAHNNLGYAHERQQALEKAEAHYRRAAELCPGSPEINNNLGSVLSRLDRAEEADAYFRRALDMDPDKWEDLANLAGTYANMRELDKALPIYRQLAEAQPDNAQLYNDYGVALALAGRNGEAKAMFDRAVAIKPDFAEAYNNLGSNRLAAGDRRAAIDTFKAAIRHRARYLEPHMNLCYALMQEQQYDEAYMYAQATVLLDDYRPVNFSNPHKVFQALCDFDACEALGDPWDNLAQARVSDIGSSFLEMLVLADCDDNTTRLVELHRRWGQDLSERAGRNPLPPLTGRRAGEKIRLGFVSSDLRRHSVAAFVVPLFERYDRDRFEIYCYTPFEAEDDPVQLRVKDLVSRFAVVTDLSYREFAQLIRDDGIDILFELNGFTRDSRIRVMAHRPAPVQIFWLGYPFTTGIPEVDYIILDDMCKPANAEWLSEEALIMPESWVMFGELDRIPISERLPFERNGVVTFGTMNNPYKITRETVALWAEVISRVPGSRFLVVRPECASMMFCANLTKEFESHGIGAERIYFVNNRAQGLNHLIYYDEMDVTLDTFPITGGNTTCDALWMGAPVVSLVGNSLHQRLSYSLMTNAGVGDLCAVSRAEYVDKAVALANDAARLREMRQGMRPALMDSPLCRADRYVETFQNMLEQVARKHGLI